MANTKLQAVDQIYQIKVTLKGIKPLIWRRIQISENTNLFKLHQVIQTVMGWENTHLHEFKLQDKKKYSHHDYEPKESLEETLNEDAFKLNQLPLQEEASFRYDYDFGDDWSHEILIEKVMPADENGFYPLCLEGQRACPPEDCGGIWGYKEFLEAMKNPNHDRHNEMTSWIGGTFDPEAFDLNSVNKQLRNIG